GLDRHALIEALSASLVARTAEDKTVVVCLDEAHSLPAETLDTLRLLADLETEKHKLLHIVLFGQPELDDKLAADSARQVRQRIATQCHLGQIERDELQPYLQRRLRAAGRDGASLFSEEALSRLHGASRGLPRLINVLAHKSLVSTADAG